MITEVKKRAFSIDEFCRRFGVGRTTAYAEIKAKRLRVAKAGRRTLIPADAAESWLRNLPTQFPDINNALRTEDEAPVLAWEGDGQ